MLVEFLINPGPFSHTFIEFIGCNCTRARPYLDESSQVC